MRKLCNAVTGCVRKVHTYLTPFSLSLKYCGRLFVFFIEVISMAGLFPLSVILHFPPEVHMSRGVGDLCPLLVRALHANKISALQFLHGGHVRVTVCKPAFREELLSNDLFFEDRKIPVTPAGVHVVTV